MTETRRLVVGVAGLSNSQLGYILLSALKSREGVESHLIISREAAFNVEDKAAFGEWDLEGCADVVYDPSDLGAAVSSGSFKTSGMAVIPCSLRSLAAIASGNTTDLIARAADVCLKERRRLVLVTEEAPLNLIHIRNMETVTLAGATILPAVPAFYHRPLTVEDLLRQIVGKVLDQFRIEHDLFKRWS